MARKKKKGFNWKEFEKQSREHYALITNKKYRKLCNPSETEVSIANGIAWLAGAVLDLKRTLDKFYKEGK